LRELLAAKDPVMVNFIFTTCSAICPVMTKVFSDVPAKLGGQAKNLRMISISLDPERDTPRELKAYAKSFQASDRWKFLTGSTQDIKTVLLAFDSYRGDKMNHEPLTLMRQSPGKTWHRLDGFATPDELVREYRKILQQ
jgi:protein SCO1/2